MNGIDFVFDRKKGVEHHVLGLFSLAKEVYERALRGTIGACAFGDDTEHPVLQAADLLAYEKR